MKGLTVILLLSLLSLVYTQTRLANKPTAKRIKPTSGNSPYMYKPPRRRIFRPGGHTPTPIPNAIRPTKANTQTCKKRKFTKHQVWDTTYLRYKTIKCPQLSCAERNLFKTKADIKDMANKVGAEGISMATARRHRTKKNVNTLGCGNYMEYVYDAEYITDHLTNDKHKLAVIPPGCAGGSPLHQPVPMGGCTKMYMSCCKGEGICNPKGVYMDYFNVGFNVITVYQEMFCDCENS